MAITIRDVQQGTHNTSTNVLALPPFAVNPANGDTILVAYSTWASLANQAAPTDSAGNTYTRVGTEVVHGVPELLGLWYAHNIVGGSAFVVTGRLIAAQYHTVIAWLIAGDLTYNADFANSGGPSAGSNPLSSGTSSPAPAGEALFLGVMTYDNSTPATDGAGWNATGVNGFTATLQGRARLPSTSNSDCYTQYLIATAAAQAATWGITGTGHDYNALVASFSPAATGGGGGMGAYSNAVIADGASHYWRLGEPSGTTAADSIAGGANAPGTISGGVTLGVAGPLADGSKAMLFNGTTGKIQTAANVTIPVVATIEAWVTPGAAPTQNQRPVVTLGTGQAPAVYVAYPGVPGQILAMFDPGAAPGDVRGTVPLTGGAWHHVAYVLNGSTLTFYVDGVLDVAKAYVRATPETQFATLGCDVAFGADPRGFWEGALAEVAIYPTALSAPTIAAHYALRTATGGGGASGPPFPVSLALVLEALA